MRKINAYICPALHHTITVCKDEGATSMFIKCPTCEATGKNEKAISMMGNVHQHFTPTHEWYKPTLEDWNNLNADIANKSLLSQLELHVKRGGLLFRPIK
ncbi:MAG: hypothetical protein C0459_03245 [Chitinophaga sp.]|jgi:hypothetical protein|nr:hypothetical protein [Chitinophaga sp.]